MQGYYNNEYGSVRLQGCTLESEDPSISLYKKYSSDGSWERSLGIMYDSSEGEFYIYGKAKGADTVKKKLGEVEFTADSIVAANYAYSQNTLHIPANTGTSYLVINATSTDTGLDVTSVSNGTITELATFQYDATAHYIRLYRLDKTSEAKASDITFKTTSWWKIAVANSN